MRAGDLKVPRTPEARLLANEIMAGINREYGLLYKDPTIQAFKAVGTVREGQKDIGRLTIIGERTNWGREPELESNRSADQKAYLMRMALTSGWIHGTTIRYSAQSRRRSRVDRVFTAKPRANQPKFSARSPWDRL